MSEQVKTGIGRPALLGMLTLTFVYLGLCLWYVSVTPYRTGGYPISSLGAYSKDIGAPDERQHTNYVRHLVEQRSFPVFDPKAPDFYESYESHQPPLYYLLAAPIQYAMGHTDRAEGWALRSVNIVLGGLLIWGVFVGMRRMTGSDAIGIAAAGFTALLPMFIAVATAVTNDMLLYLATVAVMNIIAVGIDDGWSKKLCLLLGFALGLAILSKSTAVVLLPVALLGLLIRKEKRPSPVNALLVAAVAIAVALPWLARNWILYGDLLAVRIFSEASVGSLPAEQVIANVGGAGNYWSMLVIPTAQKSFIGAFGYMDIFLPNEMYKMVSYMFIPLLVAFLWTTIRSRSQRSTNILLFSLALMVVLAFVSFNMSFYQAQGRFLYPAIFALAGALAIGLRTICLSENRTYVVFVAMGLLLLAVNI